MGGEDSIISIRTTNEYKKKSHRREENETAAASSNKSRADKIFLTKKEKRKIIIKDKILYVQMVGISNQNSTSFFKKRKSPEQIKQSCCHFECKISFQTV